MKRLFLSLLIFASGLSPQARAVNFTGLFTETFDSMGTTGTTPPTGWSIKTGSSTSVNTTWASSIPGTGTDSVASMVAASTPLTASTAPTANNNNGYNAQGSVAADRVLATAPTTNAGGALELTLTNTSGASINSIQVRYDIRRYTVATTANELPGYWLFYSLDNGTTWINVSAANPTITTVPNTVGVTISGPTTVTLASAWANNGTLLLRWVDDNASQSSPDQVIGLDNVSIATAPANVAKTGLFLNGVNQYASMGAATSTLGAATYTLECWFKRTGTGVATTTGSNGIASAIPLVTKGRGEADATTTTEETKDCNYFLGIDTATNKLCADFEAKLSTPLVLTAGGGTGNNNNYPAFGSTVLSNNVWYHAAATWDGTSWKLYINGVQETTSSPNVTPTPAPVPQSASIQHFGLGTAITSAGAPSGAAGFFQGVLDEVRVWNVARTSTQISGSKDLEITSATTGLLARYGLNEGSGASANNTVGTAGAPVGTVANSPLWVDGAPVAGNVLPTITLDTPTNNSITSAPASVSLTATAADTDGTVASVEFLRDGTVINTDSAAPYAFTDTNLTAGVYSYSARVTDNNGGITTTAAVRVSVLTDPTKTALLFDGVNDYVTMGAAPELNAGGPPSNGFTLECWFRKEGTGVTSSSGNGGVVGVPLFGKGRGEAENSNVDCNYFFGINASGQLVADFEAYPATGITAGQNYPITGTNAAITNNVWHHAAVTYDGTTFTWTLYLDGVAAGTTTAVAGALPRYDSIQHFGIGAAFTSTGVAEGAFAGRIDEVRVWNYARTASQIAAAKDYEIASATGLIGRYGLNEGTGTTAGNNVGIAGAPVGTLTNGPIWVDGAPLAANTPPTVALTAPTDGASVMTGGIVNLTAEASDTDGIARVEFYAGSTKIGEDATAPYSFDWSPSTAGDFSITAKAFDTLSTSSSSTAVTVHVIQNNPPTVTLTAPANNATIVAPGTVNITADASDNDGTIAKVEFFSGATKIGQTTTAPYAFNWTTIPTGDYSITAKATDNLGATATTAAITLHVTPPTTAPPTVAISVPTDGASFVAPATINITATANDTDGTVAKVEFFNGATKLGEDTTAPFTYAWTNVPVGDYTLTAKATDDMTATGTSTAITIHVTPNQPPVVTVTSPLNNATGIGSSTNLQLGIADPEGDAQTVTYYGRNTPPVATAASDFTFVAIPDTQFYSENINSHVVNGSVGANASFFNAQTQWIVDNQATRKIAFVSHMGDIAQNGDAKESEWIVADGAMKLIENPATTFRAHGIPWGVAPGNHDQQPNGDAGGVTNFYTKYFNFTRWDNRPYYGGHFGTKPAVSGGTATPANTNNYELFSAGGLDFIVVHMEYDVRALSAYQPVLDWADALLKAYPNRRAIITSHWIINTGNPASFSTQGQNIYNALKNNPNLFLMLCGHVNGEGFRSDTFNGHTVYSVLQDYQEITNGGNGFFRIYNFSPMNNRITIESYSPTLNRAVTSADGVPSANTSNIVLTYPMTTPVTDWIPLGTSNVSAAGTAASLAWTGLEAGKDYEWYATVNDGTTTVTTSTNRFSTAPNAAPTVAITSPTDGGFAGLNTTVNLAATASDSDGTIARVEFFDGGTKLATVTSAPYTFAWTGAAAGVHSLTAVATDNAGLDAVSAIVTLNVSNAPPTVALTEPDPEQVFDAPASIYMTADAADTDGTISKVEYYANNIKVGEATTAPYAFFWNNVFTGSYTLTAKAFDDGGASTTSGSLHVSVTNTDNVPPAVAITAPASGVAFAGNITITASASDTDGTVSKVEFFNGATKLGESTTAPYSFVWNSVALGNYTLTAKATDNDGGVSTSNSVSINVQNAPVSFTQNFDSMGTAGTALPSGWSFYGYTVGTNSTWVSSIPNADVAGGTANATLIATTTFDTVNTKSATQGYNFALSTSTSDRALGSSPTTTEGVAIQWSVTNTSGTAITAIRLGYDTRRFTAAGTANELPGYWLYYSLDNGATWTNVAALNPTLSGPTGVIVPNTTGTTTVSPTDITLSSNWGIGSTLLLRWVDDNAVATSADQIIGLDNVSLTAAAAVVGTPPTVTLTAPIATDSFVAPATVNLAATAADTDGTISKVEFYNGGTKLGEATSAPYTYSWTGVTSGTYSLTARAFDNDSNSTTSAATSITVNAAPGSGTLTRGPYLQMARPTGMTVRWRSSQAITGRVKYGTSASNLTTTVDEASATTEHIIDLSGLTPNTTYFYSVGSAFDTLAGDATTTFSTPPVVGTAADTRVWVLGDAGTASANQTAVRDAFYTWTGSRTPNMVLQLGDNAYNSGLDSEFQAGMFNIYGTMLKKSPFWSCLGNHETNQATSFVDTYPYFSIYTFPTNGECGGVASGTEHYYSWNYGNIHFISLDSMTASRSPTGAMATWLTNDLASTTATWIVCIFHHPPYTKGSHNSDTETELIEMRQNILPILEAGGVDLVLSGHSHCYERSYLLDGHYGLSGTLTNAMKLNAGDGRPTGNGAYMKPLTGNRSHFGSVYAVAGSAGQISGGSLNHPAHFLSLNNLGSLVLDVNGATLNATFVKSDGTTPDTFSMVKQGGSTAPIVSTAAATNVSTTTATLNASVNPTGTATTAKFESGTTGSYGTNTVITLSPNDGLTSQTASITLTGLTPDTTYHYRISATNTWGTVTGLDVQFTTAKTAFQVWAESAGVTGTNSGPTQNKDSDGLTNLEEYAFGTNPNASDSGPVELNGSSVTKRGSPTVTVGTNGTTVDPNAVFCRRKDASSVGLTYTVQFSSDLGTWVTSTVTPTVIADDGEYEVVKVHYPFSVNGRKAQFFHIVITAP